MIPLQFYAHPQGLNPDWGEEGWKDKWHTMCRREGDTYLNTWAILHGSQAVVAFIAPNLEEVEVSSYHGGMWASIWPFLIASPGCLMVSWATSMRCGGWQAPPYLDVADSRGSRTGQRFPPMPPTMNTLGPDEVLPTCAPLCASQVMKANQLSYSSDDDVEAS
jgi:hypothetical protein